MAFPVLAVMAAVSALGGVLGSKGRKAIDPEVLKKLFGPDAVSADTVSFFNNLINSPAGDAMMNQASTIGADISNRINARAAETGMAGGGSESGVGQFAAAAGGSATDLMKNQVRGQMFSQALEAALQNNQSRLGVYGQSKLMEQNTPTFAQALGAGMQSGAAMLASAPTGGNAKTAPNGVNTAGIDIAPSTQPSSFGKAALGAPAGLGEGAYSMGMTGKRNYLEPRDRRY